MEIPVFGGRKRRRCLHIHLSDLHAVAIPAHLPCRSCNRPSRAAQRSGFHEKTRSQVFLEHFRCSFSFNPHRAALILQHSGRMVSGIFSPLFQFELWRIPAIRLQSPGIRHGDARYHLSGGCLRGEERDREIQQILHPGAVPLHNHNNDICPQAARSDERS